MTEDYSTNKGRSGRYALAPSFVCALYRVRLPKFKSIGLNYQKDLGQIISNKLPIQANIREVLASKENNDKEEGIMTGRKSLRSTILVTVLVTISLILFIPTAIAAGEPDYVIYEVQAGESLWLISRKFETTVETIKKLNKLTSIQIVPGQALKVPKLKIFTGVLPEAIEYVVKPGDSLFVIGQKFAVSGTKIKDANGLQGATIYAGQTLRIPLPPQKSYTVGNGDTLFLIGQRFNTTIDMLVAANGLNSTSLWAGQVLFVPAAGNTTSIQPPSRGSRPQDSVDQSPEIPDNGGPAGGSWGEIPQGVVLHRIQTGESLWAIANRYNTTEAAIIATNHLETKLTMVNQPLFVPQNSDQSVTIPYPIASGKNGFGELMEWEFASWILDTYNTATLQDLDTGKSFKVRRLGGSNHADMEPVTAVDTAIMKEIYGGQWSWTRRAVLVFVDGKVIAGSMAGMPHSIKTINDNEFPGHFDLHFLNSRNHFNNAIEPEHQKAVQKAAGN